MKIQCDVCEKGEAAVYCTADEAALCNSCDHRVHHANKLASKHQRFSLIQPPPKQAPICDICQDRRAFLFCQQDRAILCRECDIPIHKANEHTGKHNRFLLTGVKLSASSSLYSSSTSSPSSSSSKSETAAISTNSDAVPRRNNKLSVSVTNNNPSTVTKADSKAASLGLTNTVTGASTGLVSDNGQMMNGVGDGNGNSNTSSIAEYLIETLPGWHVEEFFDSSSSSPFGFCKSTSDSDVMPFWDGGIDTNLSFFFPESTGLWVPQAAATTPVNPSPNQNQWFSATSNNISFGGQINSKENLTFKTTSRKHWNDDNIFAVPQISPPANSTASKRLRTLW